MLEKSNIGIVHYRIGKTDGVSLEIMKRKRLLKEMGYEVRLIAGPRQIGADYVICELEFDLPEIVKIKENAFFQFKNYASEKKLLEDIYRVSDIIEKKFLQIQQKENFDYLFLHNIFSHGRHISAARSFYNIAQETNIKIIAVNHDFYWVGSYKDLYKPQTKLVKKYLAKYVPPELPQIRHVTINSINRKALLERIGRKSLIIPDTFDFKQKKWTKDSYNQDFLKKIGVKENDLFVLQATRISARKGIELAIDFVKQLARQKEKLIGKTLYNGKKISKDSEIVLVLAGYTEKDSLDYKRKLQEKIKKGGIKTKFISRLIDARRRKENGKKIYSLWDAYVFADLVTFPSWWEGWGNQFIETIFAKKPVVVFEYPVFKADIKKEGYKVISLGNKLEKKDKKGLVKLSTNKTKKAAKEAISLLIDSQTKKLLQSNFNIGKMYHSEATLKKLLQEIL